MTIFVFLLDLRTPFFDLSHGFFRDPGLLFTVTRHEERAFIFEVDSNKIVLIISITI